MIAAEVLRLVSGALQDLEPGTEARWPWEGGDDGRIGLLDFLNAAVRAVALQRPDATAVTESILLEPGMRQRVPRRRVHRCRADALTLIELLRNMGPDGRTPGRTILPAAPEILRAWAVSGAQTAREVDNFAYDRLTDAHVYWVCPGVPEDRDVWVEATYSAEPARMTCPDDALPVPDAYAQALFHHMLAGILSGDNESGNAARAQLHMQLYAQVLGVKQQVDQFWPKAAAQARGGEL